MSYRIETNETVESALRRVAREQIDKALDEIDDSDLDRHETVHQVRKRCKKLRGLLRLVRPAAETLYDRENAHFRDAARRLSDLRDAEALLEAWDDLADVAEVDLPAAVRDSLESRRRHLADDLLDLDARLADFRSRMAAARDRVESWSVDARGFDAVGPGLVKTYRRGYERREEAAEKPETEVLHEWRKRVKYHWYHVRLLEGTWPEALGARADEIKRLSDFLGDDHDLAVLRETLREDTFRESTFREEKGLHRALTAIDRRRDALQRNAARLGQRVFAEKPKALAERFSRFWDAAHRDAETAVELAAA